MVLPFKTAHIYFLRVNHTRVVVKYMVDWQCERLFRFFAGQESPSKQELEICVRRRMGASGLNGWSVGEGSTAVDFVGWARVQT